MLTNAEIYFRADELDDLPTRVSPADPLPVTIVSDDGIVVTYDVTIAPIGGSYVAGDAVGTFFELPGFARNAGGGGTIKKVLLMDPAAQAVAATVHLFNDRFTPTADTAAWAPSDVDNAKSMGFIPLTSSPTNASGNNAVMQAIRDDYYTCIGTSLWGQLQTNGAPSYAAGTPPTLRIIAVRA